MTPKFEITESEELGYYATFNELFPDYIPYLKDKEQDRTIEVNLQFTDEDTQPSKAQLAAHKFLLTHSNQMLENLIKYLKQDEEYFMEFYGLYQETSHTVTNLKGNPRTIMNNHGFPAVKDTRDYINYFEISNINISDSEKNGIAYIGFAGGCPWDQEHGFGAAFLNEKLLHVEDWNYGNSPSWASRDNKEDKFLTENFTNFHLLEPLEKRKSRLTKLSKTIKIENTEDYDEIFDWLVSNQMIYGYRNNPVDLTSKEKIIVLNEIKELSFYGNKITKIPESISLLANLTSLSLSSNNLEFIPFQILHLSKLESLSITNNQIKQIPNEIGLLTNLKSLHLSRNNLKSIPSEIGHLLKLRHLEMSSNQLSKLPNSFKYLSQIEHLKFDNNLFNIIPVEIKNLRNLKTLNFYKNSINKIPRWISKLKFLQHLDLQYNQINSLPQSVNKIDSLKSLKISGNPFSKSDFDKIKKSIKYPLRKDLDRLERKFLQEEKDIFGFLNYISEKDLVANYSKKELKVLFFRILKHFQDFKINCFVYNPNPNEIVYDQNGKDISSIPIENMARLKRVIKKDTYLVNSICKYFPMQDKSFFENIISFSRQKFDAKLYHQVIRVQSSIKIPFKLLKKPKKQWWELWK